jgi:uncharacterized protein YxjI
MQDLFPKFFEGNEFFIDEKVNLFKFENDYKVYDGFGIQQGNIKQKIGIGKKLLRLIINKAMMPFKLEIVNMDGEIQATISRGWTFFMSTITITGPEDDVYGTIKQKFKLLKPTFIINDSNGDKIAEINGDWKAWNFSIKDANEKNIGTISKKWNGAMKEIFTSADKYNVTIVPEVVENRNKIVIVAGAITIDMILKESKN